MIGIIDYGMGNLKSVKNALDYLQIQNEIISSYQGIENVDKIIIPGVGSFKTAMDNLENKNFIEPILKFANSGKHVLGICLGMQLLADNGTEPSFSKGLGLIPGKVEIIDTTELPIPHMGWNGLVIKNEHKIMDAIKKGTDYYFVHSYAYNTSNSNHIIAITEYGQEIPAIIRNEEGNVIGMQFHPEKSQKQGLKLLENFSKL